MNSSSPPLLLIVTTGLLLVACGGCSKSAEHTLNSGAAPKPEQAASQLQKSFETASPDVKQTATTAAQALQNADYDSAIKNLQSIKTRPDLSFDQGMAIHASEVSLEARLIAAMESGDPNAKQAYERLKKSRKH